MALNRIKCDLTLACEQGLAARSRVLVRLASLAQKRAACSQANLTWAIYKNRDRALTVNGSHFLNFSSIWFQMYRRGGPQVL